VEEVLVETFDVDGNPADASFLLAVACYANF
jgi:hypothetical protein